jgi:hypothetical protein
VCRQVSADTKCFCRPGFFAQGEAHHSTLCVRKSEIVKAYMVATEVVGRCVDASKDKNFCPSSMSHPYYGCNAKYGYQNMASLCQASCGKYCAQHSCKPAYASKYCVPIKDGNCQDTTAVDFACPHHEVGLAVPRTCDDVSTDLDDQCAAAFTQWWGKCGAKLRLAPALHTEYQGFYTKCKSVACRKCARHGGKCKAGKGHRRLEGKGSRRRMQSEVTCWCPRGYDSRTLCATKISDQPGGGGGSSQVRHRVMHTCASIHAQPRCVRARCM